MVIDLRIAAVAAGLIVASIARGSGGQCGRAGPGGAGRASPARRGSPSDPSRAPRPLGARPGRVRLRGISAELNAGLAHIQCPDVDIRAPSPSLCPCRQCRGASLNQSSWPLIKRWTDEEHAQLKTMAAEGARVDEIALALNRSEKAVRARAAQHGIELRLVAVKSRSSPDAGLRPLVSHARPRAEPAPAAPDPAPRPAHIPAAAGSPRWPARPLVSGQSPKQPVITSFAGLSPSCRAAFSPDLSARLMSRPSSLRLRHFLQMRTGAARRGRTSFGEADRSDMKGLSGSPFI